jgi:hypothetical protein
MTNPLRTLFPLVALLGFGAVTALAQAVTAGTPVATIERLFTAMNAGDSAAARRAFVPFARVVPVRGVGAAPLSVDQFAAYVASITPGSWRERIWEPRLETAEPLAQLWFEYDVVRGDSVRQCGRQSVQLIRDAEQWRIMSMAFSTSSAPCGRAPK